MILSSIVILVGLNLQFPNSLSMYIPTFHRFNINLASIQYQRLEDVDTVYYMICYRYTVSMNFPENPNHWAINPPN